VEGSSEPHVSRLATARRQGERVTPLELFFDLVFVLAITQCTALMAAHPSWSGLGQGLLVLGVLWWAWTGYAWLTSVIDPEQGAIRLLIFAAMAAMLIASLCVPEAFASLSLAFALAIGVFRTLHIALFILASPDDPDLRRSVVGLAASTAIAVGLLVCASLFDGLAQAAFWVLALAIDLGGPYFFGTEGWRLVPGHFAERHGLIVLIALGESIVAIGAGASGHLDLGIGAAAVLGVGLAAGLWWIYFDVVALISSRRLADAEVGRVQNALARDGYSYIHLLLVAGIVLAAYGLETALHHTDRHLHDIQSFALFGGVALYLLGLVCFRLRHVRTLNRQRFLLAVLLLLLAPLGTEVPALIPVAVVDFLVWTMIAYELHGYDERRDRLRSEFSVAHGD
jgi:low temperature requirement protein LtrA